ncbi:VRR-NUC domain-containing protein [Pseudomonas amygdali]|uniref:VRR-NUC domain-containing protein n=1 Tax=Pseudomonas amygdali TaxID=47877 RepID=UPI00128B8721|nr:VRR-NUC domain-containing protein [Pseudomonas amygdali]
MHLSAICLNECHAIPSETSQEFNMTVSFNFYQTHTLQKTIFYKRMVIDFADSLGEEKFFELTHHFFAKSPAELRKWRVQLDSLVLPQKKMKEISDRIAHGYDEIKIKRLFNLVRKNRFRQPHYNAYLGTHTAELLKSFTNNEKLKKADIQHLRFFGLIDLENNLTDYASHYELARSSLPVQSRHLGISVEELNAPKTHARPELNVKDYLNNSTSTKWFWTENDLHFYFHSTLMSGIYQELGIESYHGPLEIIARDQEEKFITAFTAEYFFNHIKNLEKGRKKDKSVWLNSGEQLQVNEAQEIYTALGYEFFLNLLKKDLGMPGLMTMGWPDLIGWGNGRYEFVEVKQNDKITFGQLRTLPFLKEMGIPFRIIKLI